MDSPYLSRLLSALEVFRAVAGEVQLQQFIIFLYIASHDGCLQETITKVSGVTESSVSRNLDRLGAVDRHGNPGLKLIRRERDPEYYKRWTVHLTSKGEQLASLIVTQLEDY